MHHNIINNNTRRKTKSTEDMNVGKSRIAYSYCISYFIFGKQITNRIEFHSHRSSLTETNAEANAEHREPSHLTRNGTSTLQLLQCQCDECTAHASALARSTHDEQQFVVTSGQPIVSILRFTFVARNRTWLHAARSLLGIGT